MDKDALFLTSDNVTEEQLQELRQAIEATEPIPIPTGLQLISLSRPKYFIASEAVQFENDIIHVYRTEASLTRTKRYCRVMGWELIAYGEMQVFGDTEYLSATDMRLAVCKKAEERRERRRRWSAMSDEERNTLTPQPIEIPLLHPSDRLMELWSKRQPCESLVFNWNSEVKYDGQA